MLLTNDRGGSSRPAEGGGPFLFAKIRCEQGTAYSVQQTGGDDRCSRDKNGCDQVMQRAVGHVTLLGPALSLEGASPLLLVLKRIKASKRCGTLTVQSVGSAHGTGGKGPGIGHDTRALRALGGIYSLKLDAFDAFHAQDQLPNSSSR